MSRPRHDKPAIVDLDTTKVELTRFEWTNGELYLTLAPIVEDPNAWIEFRIVGVEPRIWWMTGIDGASTDVRGDCVLVRVPLVAGDLEFLPSSY